MRAQIGFLYGTLASLYKITYGSAAFMLESGRRALYDRWYSPVEQYNTALKSQAFAVIMYAAKINFSTSLAIPIFPDFSQKSDTPFSKYTQEIWTDTKNSFYQISFDSKL